MNQFFRIDDDLCDRDGDVVEPSDAERGLSMGWLIAVVCVGAIALWLTLKLGGGPWH